jgi:hypothetical protein
MATLATMCQKRKQLAAATAISSKFYAPDFKPVSHPSEEVRGKKGDPKFTGKCHDVIENTWWENVTFRPCHDVDENNRDTNFLPRCYA